MERATVNHRGNALSHRVCSESDTYIPKARKHLNPTKSPSHIIIVGMASAKNGNFDQAIMELHLAIQNEPGWVMPLFTLGVVYGNQGELDKAIQAWERATQLDADFAKAHYNLAVAYLHKEEKTRSIASLRKAIQIDKEALPSAKAGPRI